MMVMNLNTGAEYHYSGITPREAVIAAYAQGERQDWNTWDYEKKYGYLVRISRSSRTISCGEYSTLMAPTTERRVA
jgi:hypothetical protein